MKSTEMGVEPLYKLAEQLLCGGLSLDVIDLSIGEKPVPRTDPTDIRMLLKACGDSDLVIPLGGSSGFVALEVDETKGGTETLGALMNKVEIPKTAIVKPAGGPIYFLLRTEKSPLTCRKRLGDGLELVANDTCIIVPPKDSHDKTQGWWKNFHTEVEVAPIPEKLAAFL